MSDLVEMMQEKGLFASATAGRVRELLGEGKSVEEAVLEAQI